MVQRAKSIQPYPRKIPISLAIGLVLGGSACASPPKHVPVDREYAIERASVPAEDDFELYPAPEAVRLLKVRVSGGYWAKSTQHAVFWSDGTLHVTRSASEHRGDTLASAMLSAEELARLNAQMGALELCRDDAEVCMREDSIDDGFVSFEVVAGPLRGRFASHYQGSTATPRAFMDYEAFVLRLINQTLGGESAASLRQFPEK